MPQFTSGCFWVRAHPKLTSPMQIPVASRQWVREDGFVASLEKVRFGYGLNQVLTL
jgi:hypothetical protein